jgi:hypothetical protein
MSSTANGKLLLEAYPLHWPERQLRKTPSQRRRGPFKVSLGIARDELLDELRLLGARDVIARSLIGLKRFFDDARRNQTRTCSSPTRRFTARSCTTMRGR